MPTTSSNSSAPPPPSSHSEPPHSLSAGQEEQLEHHSLPPLTRHRSGEMIKSRLRRLVLLFPLPHKSKEAADWDIASSNTRVLARATEPTAKYFARLWLSVQLLSQKTFVFIRNNGSIRKTYLSSAPHLLFGLVITL